MNKKIFFICVFIILPKCLLGQYYFRMSADFSIKEKYTDGTSNLTMGRMYYDVNFKKLIFDIHFPKKQTLVFEDSSLLLFENQKLIQTKKFSPFQEYSVYHLALTGKLIDFGMKGSMYSIQNVEKDGDMVITTWKPEDRLKKNLGDIVMSMKDKTLYGIVFFNPQGRMLGKQILRNYQKSGAFSFPGEVIQITYLENGSESNKLYSYSNVIVNETGKDHIYNYITH